MQYRSRTGKVIDREEWYELYLNRKYSVVKTHFIKDVCRIDCSWIGVAAQNELTPKLFLVQAWNTDAKDKHSDYQESWHPTEESAVIAFSALQAMVKSMGKIPKVK